MYRFFSLCKRLWVRMGMPMKPFVRWVRHRVLGTLWPAKHTAPQAMYRTAVERATCPPLPGNVRVTVIIPTAGKDMARIEQCLSAVYNASEGVHITPILVVSPSTPAIEYAIHERFSTRATLVFCTTFNYPRSLNMGLERRGDADYVLLLNDDCFFTSTDAIRRLIRTLQEQQWACIGPWVRNEERDDGLLLHATRGLSATPLREPVPGMCVLWDAKWIDRVGSFDADFGEGYGCDEADYSLRARNRGARWGRDDSVEVLHMHHATFGEDANITSGKHQRNLKIWQRKYPGIDSWGKGVHWDPLPGIHVAIAGHNVAPWIARALDSVEQSLDGFRWILTFADDASTDDTLRIVTDHRSTADRKLVYSFSKAQGAAEAKNRAIAMGTPYAEQYPMLCLMDSDDVMLPPRIRLLLPHLYNHGLQAVFGAYETESLKGYTKIQTPDANMQGRDGYLHPCSTLIHRSLVPTDGVLFAPELISREDEKLWRDWFAAGIRLQPVPGKCVHKYIERMYSVMRSN